MLERPAAEYHVTMDLLKSMILRTNRTKYYSNTRLLRTALTKTVSQQWLQEAELVRVEE